MLIAQITDIHIGFDPANPEELNRQRLMQVLQRLGESPSVPDLLLLTGDLTEFGDVESFRWLADAVAQCPFPAHAMVGNHDLREALIEAFPATPMNDGFVQYALDCGDIRLVLLDTLEKGRHGGAFCEARAAWLASELTAHPDTPTVIAMHHPPIQSGIAWLDNDVREPWVNRFARTIAGHAQVKAILCGHLHRSIHTLWNGVPLTVCASSAPLVALDLRPIDSAEPDGRAMITDEPPVYALHRWDGERVISFVEAVSGHSILARFDTAMQPMVRAIESERNNS